MYWINYPLLATALENRKQAFDELIFSGAFWYCVQYECETCQTKGIVGNSDYCDHFACSSRTCTADRRGPLRTLAAESLDVICRFLGVDYPDEQTRVSLHAAEARGALGREGIADLFVYVRALAPRYGLDPTTTTDNGQRQVAKAARFGAMYGSQGRKLLEDSGVSLEISYSIHQKFDRVFHLSDVLPETSDAIAGAVLCLKRRK